jgi:predicted DNA-binding ribbon-helix-helix protein
MKAVTTTMTNSGIHRQVGRSTIMKSTIQKRSITIGGHKTSVSLEQPFWSSLKMIADERPATLSELVDEIDQGRGEHANLSSSIRLFVLAYFSGRAATAAKQFVASHLDQAAHAPAG